MPVSCTHSMQTNVSPLCRYITIADFSSSADRHSFLQHINNLEGQGTFKMIQSEWFSATVLYKKYKCFPTATAAFKNNAKSTICVSQPSLLIILNGRDAFAGACFHRLRHRSGSTDNVPQDYFWRRCAPPRVGQAQVLVLLFKLFVNIICWCVIYSRSVIKCRR